MSCEYYNQIIVHKMMYKIMIIFVIHCASGNVA